MEENKAEALKSKEIAEKCFAERDFTAAKNNALKAKALYPGLEGISQMVATFEVYVASEFRCNGETDYYSMLGLKPSANKAAVKRQYRKMAVLLHPDKNKTVGADGAFKLVSEAWDLLSDSSKRSNYDLKRTTHFASGVNQTNLTSVHTSGVTGFNNCSNSSTSHGRIDTFWTVCTSCKVQYEYLRKFVNKRLSCKNCRGTFIAVETGTAPVNGSFPYCPWSYVSGNGYGSHCFDGFTYVPTNPTFFTGNRVSNFHAGHGYDCVSNVSSEWNSFCVASADVYQTNGNICISGANVKPKSNGKSTGRNNLANMKASTPASYDELSGSKDDARPGKKRKVVVGVSYRNGYEEKGERPASEGRLANGNSSMENGQKVPTQNESHPKHNPNAPLFDARKLLIEKARTEIIKKLDEMKSVSAPAAAINIKSEVKAEVCPLGEAGLSKKADSNTTTLLLDPNSAGPIAITVPDSDFHDFDEDRSEECFKPKQIWALYDEEDGMPRLYCLIREIISVRPFKILITYLISKTDTEFGPVNWLVSGFTKSCGNFRARNSDIVDRVNIFSHVLSREKAGRGGCVRIYPKSGDIWAIYRNRSPDWDRSTPDEVRHQYEMVEVLDDYSEELGVCVSPLVKLDGFKTVYQSNANKDAIRWIPRREMLSFSHQVPSYLLKGEANNLPDKCWDLDPAATPDELLHTITETKNQ